jgi:hypothetical protein
MISREESHKKWLSKNPTYYRDRQRKIRKGQWKIRWNVFTKEQNKKYYTRKYPVTKEIADIKEKRLI